MAQLGRPNLKHQWYACVPTGGAARLSPLRHLTAVEVHCDDGTVWVRGPTMDDVTRGVLRSVLGCRLYRPLGDGQLVPEGKSVPHGYEPQGHWTPLEQWLTTAPPRTRMPVQPVDSAPLRLVRSSNFEPAGLLYVTRSAWHSYAATAPQARLDRLVFATSVRHTVVVGTPLPPTAGDYYWLRDGIAAPVGFHWAPAVDVAVLRELFQLSAGDIALLMHDRVHDRACSVIRSDQFVGATRSAVRLTEGVGHAGP